MNKQSLSWLSTFFFLLLIAMSCQLKQNTAQNEPDSTKEADEKLYFFSYFKGGGKDGLHLAWSEDGYQWKALQGDSSLLTPTAGEDKLMRDPCIIQGPDGKFHMVWTVSWNEKGIGYAWSEDLVNWSEQRFLPVMMEETGTMNCWAPELFYNEKKGEYLIYWASTVEGKFEESANQAEDKWNHRMYATTTRDFEHFSETKLFYDPGHNVIDAVVVWDDSLYRMVIKDETKFPEVKKDLHLASAQDLSEGFGELGEGITGAWVEGPTITRVGDQWVIYFDRYREHKYGAIASSDWKQWTDISDKISLPEGIRHGTIFRGSKKLLEGF